jgi:peptidoglycan/xylan/chitin deacetylase (PgdA/CDA1 family)
LVLLTFDDAVTPVTFDLVSPVFARNHNNPNGCPLAATFFVSTDWTDYWLVNRLHAAGHEIAVHTMTHGTSLDTDLPMWRAEITGARAALANLGGVPKQRIVGFRAPYLISEDESFQVLREQGMLYDSSMTELVPQAKQRSQIFPYTLDHGAAQECNVGTCATRPYPGLWEIPMWQLYQSNGDPSPGAMDPPGTREQVLELLERNLLLHHEGNRSPMGVFLHAAWLTDDHAAALAEFLSFAGGLGDVWFVTSAQAIAFFRAPVDAQAARTLPAFQCSAPASGRETCDGADNDGDGEIDEGLVKECAYERGWFKTCAPCPQGYPTPDLPGAEAVDSGSGTEPQDGGGPDGPTGAGGASRDGGAPAEAADSGPGTEPPDSGGPGGPTGPGGVSRDGGAAAPSRSWPAGMTAARDGGAPASCR